MRAKILLAGLALGASLHAQPPTDLLQRVTVKVLDTVDRLTRYLCTQTIERQQYEPAPGRKESPCEPAAHRRTVLTTSDRLHLDVAISSAREMYSWVGESHFDDRGLFELVRNGAVSTGAFSSFLALIFRVDNTGFAYQGVVQEGGRALERFEFRVPAAMSHYVFSGGGQRVDTGYYGAILVDPVTADLVRLEVHTEGLPPETGSCQSSSTLDYTRLHLNDAEFLLPSRAELFIEDVNGVELKNTTVYSGCREFLGESTLHFEGAQGSDSGGSGGPRSANAGSAEWPARLPFTIAFTQAIDPDSAAAGDRVPARLIDPIRDAEGHILAPGHAPVVARLLQVRRFYGQIPALRLTVKLESIEVGGASRPLSAEPDTMIPVAAPSRSSLRTRSDHMMADNQDRHAAIFDLRSLRNNLVAPSGFESKWFTAGAKP